VTASPTAVVFSICKWSIEVHDCVMGDSTSFSLVVVLMDPAINFVIFQIADAIVLARTEVEIDIYSGELSRYQRLINVYGIFTIYGVIYPT
jgi:hypothetical protein